MTGPNVAEVEAKVAQILHNATQEIAALEGDVLDTATTVLSSVTGLLDLSNIADIGAHLGLKL